MTTVTAFFNNKGGVGKTTLACNYANFLARNGFRVLVVDCDPQGNATQLLLSDDQWDSLFNSERWRSGSIVTIFDNIMAGDSGIQTEVDLMASTRFEVSVLPGHPAFALTEDKLSDNWQRFRGGDLGGGRVTSWAKRFADHFGTDYEAIIFDLSPSLGAINRSILLGADNFVTPLGTDLFSKHSIANILEWLQSTKTTYERSYDLVVENHRKNAAFTEVTVPEDAAPKWAGYTTQQYIRRGSNGDVVSAFEVWKDQIAQEALKLVPIAVEQIRGRQSSPHLGDVPHMFSMTALAHSAHSPIIDLSFKDGIKGAQDAQRAKYVGILDATFEQIASTTGVANVS